MTDAEGSKRTPSSGINGPPARRSGPQCRPLPRAVPRLSGMRPSRRNWAFGADWRAKARQEFCGDFSWLRSPQSRLRRNAKGPDPSRLPVAVRTARPDPAGPSPSHLEI